MTTVQKPPTLAERIIAWARDRLIYSPSASLEKLHELAAEVAAIEDENARLAASAGNER